MNVNLIYQQTGYSFQISQFTPLSFIYEVANKVFHIAQNSIKLFYKEQYIPNDQTYASNYFKKFPVIINILEMKKKNTSNDINNNEKVKIIEEKQFNDTFSEKAKHRKKNFIKCQICTRKNSIFYCRNCNQFICFECNIRYPEHFSHKKISLESGDLLLCFEDYRNSVLEQLNELNNAYRFSSENIYSDQKRGEIFDYLINTLKDLDKKTQSLTIMGTSYKCNNDVLNNFNKELREIEAPKYKEETINSFGLVNEKELEIQNYVSYVNLQILKSRFNIKMTIFFNEAKKILNELMTEINSKLHDSLYLKEKNYNDLVSYNKEKYKENKESSSSSSPNSHNSHSQGYSSSRSLNKSSSINLSITNKNENEVKHSEKNSSNNNIHNKIELNNIKKKKHNKKNSKIISFDSGIEEKSHKNLICLRNNHTEENIKKLKSCSTIIKDKKKHNNNEISDQNLITLPKIKVLNDTQKNVEISKGRIFSPDGKIKKNNIINLKNINTIRQSIQNILKKNQSKEIKQIKQRNNNNLFNIIKITSNESPIQSLENEKTKNLKLIQNKLKFKKAASSLKLKSINIVHDNDNDINKINDENKNRFFTINNENTIENENVMKSFDKYDKHETNKIINSLKKIKPNHKIKLYDIYKIKEKEKEKEKEVEKENEIEKEEVKEDMVNEENIDKENPYSPDPDALKLQQRRSYKSIPKHRIYQKEK